MPTDEEKIAERIRQTGPIPEQIIHIMYYGASKMTGIDPWGFGEVLDSASAYSLRLHNIIESAIEKKYLSRNLDGLLVPK